MFGESSSAMSTSGTSKDILASGSNPLAMDGVSALRKGFAQVLKFKPQDCNQTVLDETAKQAGRFKGMKEVAQRVSQQKIEAGREMLEVYGIALNHADQALGLEQQWRNKTARTLQSMSPKMLDIRQDTQHHAGFAEYCNQADQHIKF